MDLGSLIAAFGLPVIFLVMLAKELGIPVPIPSDFVMVAAGIQIAAGAYPAAALLGALAVAIVAGGSAQFLLSRTAGRAVVYGLAQRVGIGADLLDRAVARLGAGGPRAVFVGLNIPGARAAVVPAAGLARLAYAPFAAAALGGSLLFYGWHVALGFALGPTAIALLERYTAPVLAGAGAAAIIGLAAWIWLRRRSGGGAGHAWTDAACPVCLAITAVGSETRPRG